MRRGTIKAVLVLVVLALAACRPGLASTPTPTPTLAPAPLSIYFATRDQMTFDSPPPPPYHLFALNASDGKVRWTRPGSNPTASRTGEIRPVLDHGVVYMGDEGVSAVNATTGTLLWHYQADGTNVVNAVTNGVVYAAQIANLNGQLYALDASTGKLLWRSAMIRYLSSISHITVMSHQIYVTNASTSSSDSSNNLTAYDVTNGAQLWRHDIGSNSGILPSLQANGDQLYAIISDYSSLQGFLTALNTRDGSQRWRFPQTGQASITLEGVAHGLVYITSWDDNSLYALNANDGSVKWQVQVGLTGSTTLTNDAIYLSSEDGTIYALDPGNGAVKWQVQVSGQSANFDIRVHMAQQGLLYVSRTQDGIYALNTSDGSVKWHSTAEGLAQGIDFSVVGASAGVVYLDVSNNIVPNPDTLYALNTADGSSLWSYHVRDSGHLICARR